MTLASQIAFNNGSINRDSTLQYVRTDQGQVIDRVNLRVNSKDRNKRVNEKIIGNVLINTTLPSGTNRMIGWCSDYKNNAIIYCVYNNTGKHCIFRYFINTKTIQRIWFDESTLGFENTLLKACVVEDIFYWVNGTQQPKSFTITKAVNYTYGLAGEKYSIILDNPFNETIFPLIKRPPRFCPSCIYGSETEYNANNLRKSQFQFKYCYEYKDFQRSAWSPISKIPLPQNELTFYGEWVTDIKINNKIEVTYNTGGSQVSKILIAARESNPLNTGGFFTFAEVNKYDIDGNQVIFDNTDETVTFYNNTNLGSIDTNINNRYCDYVPLAGNDILHFDNKYIGIAYPLVDYDPIQCDYELEVVTEAIDFSTSSISMITKVEFKYLGNLTWGKVRTIYIPEFKPNSSYKISFEFNGVSYSGSFPTFATEPAGYPVGMRNDFLASIRAVFGNDFVDNIAGEPGGIQFEGAETGLGDGYKEIKNLVGEVIFPDDTYLTCVKSLKRGQYHPFGIIYNDEFGRYNIVFTDDDNSSLYAPIVGDDPDEISEDEAISCSWTINHIPPDWATTYRWCYIKNKSYDYFLYALHVEVIEGTGTDTEAGENGIPLDKYMLKINQELDLWREAYPNFAIADYSWVNGDRVRVVGEEESYEILCEWVIYSNVEGEDDTRGFLIDADISNSGEFVEIIEIYRSKTEPSPTIYFEIGEEFEILNPKTADRVHEGQTQNQVIDINGNSIQPAKGVMDFGDVYLRYRYDSTKTPYVVEDANYSDYYVSSSIDLGRIGLKIDTKQKYLNRFVRSENFLENTEYNLLNVWMPDADYFDASDAFGRIIGVREVGDVLKIIQEHKETSVYVGKVLAKEGDGSDIVLDSSNVFGTTNKYIEIRGSRYSNSIVNNRRYLYYFDDSTGEFIRSSANGQIPISSLYHLRSWFEDKAKELREAGGYKDVIVACDNDYEEVLISFIVNNTIETWVFSEEEQDNGWMYYATFKTNTQFPENFAFHGDELFSFMSGKLYRHNVGVNNTFYGQLQPCSLSFVINLPPYISKKFDVIRINSDKNIWNVQFDIKEMHNYTQQKSYLKPTIIREKNGILQSDILRNVLNRAGVEDIQLLHKGHDLTGEILQVTLSNNDNNDVILGEVEIKFQINK